MPVAIARDPLLRLVRAPARRLRDPASRSCSASLAIVPGRGALAPRRHARSAAPAGGGRRGSGGLLGVSGSALAATATVALAVYGAPRRTSASGSRAADADRVYTGRSMFEIGSSLREARIRQGLELRARWRRGRRSARSTCAPSRTSGSTSFPGTRTQGLPAGLRGLARPRRPALRRRVQLALRRRARRRRAPRCRARPVARQRRRRDRRESRLVGIALAAILVVTALVIAAWRFGGHDDPQVEGDQRADAARRPRRSARRTQQVTAHDPRRQGPVVHGGAGGRASGKPLYRARSRGADPALHEEGAVRSRSHGPATSSCRSTARASPCSRRAARLTVSGADRRQRVSARPRAAIVVTGSELVRGERTDLNGPFFAREALSLGLEPARIAIVGDDPDELEAALREGLEARRLPRLGRARADARRPHRRARRAGRRARRSRVDAELEARDRGRLARGRRAAAAGRTPTSPRA